MIIFTPCDTYKEGSAAGYWKDQDGKLFVDFIRAEEIGHRDVIEECKKLFEKGEKAVFLLVNQDFSYIVHPDFSTVLLRNIWGKGKLTQDEKNQIIDVFGGLTCFFDGRILYCDKA